MVTNQQTQTQTQTDIPIRTIFVLNACGVMELCIESIALKIPLQETPR